MLEGAKSIGAGAATIASAGAAIGIGNVFSSLIHSVARNPSLAKQSFGYANDGLFDLIRILIEERRFHSVS
ncbi:ATP synthase subunit 9, mitochondrial [Lycium ferocissimum]|uniref:ATP synthase subunit 9, mitochondrial n=1 Tax=Lycium ferocissimum TaxID=112874 RepID=UPI0028167088|nr:ATP synthase subunit 9, mitochondrial [Lycium ferocissimum]